MAAVKVDAMLSGAVEVARQAALGIAEPGTVGEHVGVQGEAERLVTHFFACTSLAYPGWRWAVTLSRVPRARKATVSETHLVPGADALLPPEWLPYVERLAPGDIGPGDRSPYIDEDPLLEGGFEATGDEDVDQVGFVELGLGRKRVLSAQGRDRAAQRWYDGSNGPSAEVARKSAKSCTSCGFFIPMPGALRSVFGVCASEWSPSDGTVVSLDHGCGAHSEVDVEQRKPDHIEAPVLDDTAIEVSNSQ